MCQYGGTAAVGRRFHHERVAWAPLIAAPDRVTRLITPNTAPVPYSAEPGPRTTPTRSRDVRSIGSSSGAAPKDAFVHRVTIDEDQDAIVVVGGTAEPSGAEVRVVAVVAQVKATHPGECVLQGAVAELLDFLVSEDRDRARRLSGCLLILARGADGHVEEGVEAQGIRSGLLRHRCAPGARNTMSRKALESWW